MVSVQGCSDRTEGGLAALLVRCSGGCHPPTEVRPPAARLLLALDRADGFLPKRQATRAMLTSANVVLTSSERASAARTISRLVAAGFVERRDADVWLTQRARMLLEWQRARIERGAAGRSRGDWS